MQTTNTSNSLKIKDIEFYWNDSQSFNLSIKEFDISSGKKFLLLGESGSGKSTLLSLISGVLIPNKGSINIGNTDICSLNSHKRDIFRANNIGVIFQQFNLLGYVSPMTNILLPCFFADKQNKKLINNRKDTALELAQRLGLNRDILFTPKATSLSVGQQQRIAVIRALINQPKLIIADEPTSALDKHNQQKFIKVLLEIAAEIKSTVLMVSHDDRLSKQFDNTISINQITKQNT